MSEPTETMPPSLVFNSVTWSQRLSASWRSNVSTPRWPAGVISRRSETNGAMRASIVSRGVPGTMSVSDRQLSCWYLVLHMTSLQAASHRTKDSVMLSMAVRSRWSAASERAARWRCSVTSTAMPMSWISGASGSTTWARARIHTQWPSACFMRKTWSIWSVSRDTIRLARSNRSPSSGWMMSATSPKDSIDSQCL